MSVRTLQIVAEIPAESRSEHDRGPRPSASTRDPLPFAPISGRQGFRSVLTPDGTAPRELREPPAGFADLRLDRVLDAVTAGRESYDLRPLLHAAAAGVEEVAHRQAVVRDLDREPLRACLAAFAADLQTMRRHRERADRTRYVRQRQAWFLEAVAAWCDAVERLAEALPRAQPRSAGLRGLQAHLTAYARSAPFAALAVATRELTETFAGLRYLLRIDGSRVVVDAYHGEADYSAEVERDFARFRTADAPSRLVRFPDAVEMDHVEAAVLDLVAKRHAEPFARLDDFCARHADFADPALLAVDRELCLLAAYRAFTARLEPAGLPFCLPRVSGDSKQVCAEETFDLALADQLVAERGEVVRNDWRLDGEERIFVVTGPNQGGKTTFARTFGQLHHLARVGLPVPGRAACLFHCDRILTHFERQEDLSDLHGKLEDDLVRVHRLLADATPASVVVMNESFSSTALRDARFLGRRVLERLIALDLLAVYVTFVDELATLGPSVVSMTSTVAPGDPTIRRSARSASSAVRPTAERTPPCSPTATASATTSCCDG